MEPLLQAVRKTLSKCAYVCLSCCNTVLVASLCSFSLVREEVSFTSLWKHELSSSRDLNALFCAGVSLDLHITFSDKEG